jgi:tetratricopeptide (TPR) repeat protein
MKHQCTRFLLAALLVMLTAAPTLSAPKGTRGSDLAQVIDRGIDDALDAYANRGSGVDALRDLRRSLDLAIAYGDDEEMASMVRAAVAVRTVEHLELAGLNVDRAELLAYLRRNARIGEEVPLLLDSEEDLIFQAYSLLDRMRVRGGDKLEEYATLVAALCAVHDRGLSRRVNENRVSAPKPMRILDYYIRYADDLETDIHTMPPQLLTYVVDVTTPIEELEWAHGRFGGTRAIGPLYFKIRYDYEALSGNKRLTREGFNLPNILKFGGVCVDQGHFAAEVGKSLGIPATRVRASGTQVGHCWLGYLNMQRRGSSWDFQTGRYRDYAKLMGEIEDPQTGHTVSDARVGVLALLYDVDERKRIEAQALVVAAGRLHEIRTEQLDYPPLVDGLELEVLREATLDDELKLLESALNRCAGLLPAWDHLVRLAEAKEIDEERFARWGKALDRMTGGNHLDFQVEVLAPLVRSTEDVKQQDVLWHRLLMICKRRPDLASAICIERGKMWKRAGDKRRAYELFTGAAFEFLKDGPFVLDALIQAELLLKEAGHEEEIVPLYRDAWQRLTKPRYRAPFVYSSTWYRVGSRFNEHLRAAGLEREARTVATQLTSR